MMRSAFSGVTSRYHAPSGIHDADRAVGADAQALALRAVARTVGAGDVELLHPPLEVLPRRVAGFEIDAIRAEANEEVTRQLADAERGRGLLRRLEFLAISRPIIRHRACSVRGAGGSMARS